MIVGIDLGTTNSAIAYMTADGPKLIPNSLGKVLTPSVVGIDKDGTVLTGETALDFMVVQPSRCVTAFKRFMGTDRKVELADQVFTPEQLSALILRSLKSDAEHLFGNSDFRAVVTVPAYFNDSQRKATLDAAEIAQLEVVRLVNEPTAAAISYGFHESKDEKDILVVDLGGGTFDVSAVEMYEGVVDVRASFGDSFLGGEDFTQVIASEILKSRNMSYEEMEFKRPLMISRLKFECERAKKIISSDNFAKVRIPDENGYFYGETALPESGKQARETFGKAGNNDLASNDLQGKEEKDANTFVVWREQFEFWSKNLLARLHGPINRVLTDASWTKKSVDEIILVGGSTRMPMMRNQIQDEFNLAPQCRLNPDEVVALGAAIQGGLFENNKALQDMAVTDIAPFTLGVEISKEFGETIKTGYMLPIIHRNRKIPSSQVRRVSTVYPNQEEIRIKVYQGEGRRTESCTFLGEFNVSELPQGESGQEIDIRFSYDLNGVLEVEATVVATMKRVQHIITSKARGLTRSEITDSIARLKLLKPTPRDQAQWQSLLKRAERQYEQLPPGVKDALGFMIDRFEAAMMDGDKQVVNQTAEELKMILERTDDFKENEDGDYQPPTPFIDTDSDDSDADDSDSDGSDSDDSDSDGSDSDGSDSDGSDSDGSDSDGSDSDGSDSDGSDGADGADDSDSDK